MIIFEIFQFAMFKRFKKALIYYVANHVNLFKIKINRLLYLHVTIITQSKSFFILNKVKIKSIVKMRNKIDDDNIDCNDS